MTFCKNCSNFINLDVGSPRENVWYNHLCAASPLPTRIDPFDGNEKPFSKNDLGQEHPSRHWFEYCRDVNNGECQKYSSEAKVEK